MSVLTTPSRKLRAFGKAQALGKVQVFGTVILAVVCLVAIGWQGANATRRGQATVAVLEHRVDAWWQERTQACPRAPGTGQIGGTVTDEQGRPLEDATVVVSDRYGRTIRAVTDARGRYVLKNVPAGRVVPAVTGHGYADQVYRRVPWAAANAVRVRPGRTTAGVNLRMAPYRPLEWAAHARRWEQVTVSNDYPRPTSALRTRLTFERDGYEVTCYLYEPLDAGSDRLPGLVAAYPGPVLNWEPASIAFVAQGYAVLGIAPVSMRDLDVAADTDDLRVAMRLFYRGEISARVDPGRIVALGGSFSSLALLRALHQAPYVRGVALLGALTDVYALRYDAYNGGYTGYSVYPRLEWAMWSLGRPDRAPRMYVENSATLHVRGLPPLCLIHGTGDAVVPYDQSERFAEHLAEAGQPYELHIYPDTGHYPGIHDPDPDTEAMYEEMVRFFAHLPESSELSGR